MSDFTKSDIGRAVPRRVIFPIMMNVEGFLDAAYTKKGYYATFFDKRRYGNIESIRFCSSIRVTGGTGYVQLYDDTADAPIASSDISTVSLAWDHLVERSGDIKDNLPDSECLLTIQLYVTGGFTISNHGAWLEINIA